MVRWWVIGAVVALVALGPSGLSAPISGDLDDDGDIDSRDMRMFIRYWRTFKAGGAWNGRYSLDGDERLDQADAALMIRNFLNRPVAEEGSGVVALPDGSPLDCGALRVATALGTADVADDGACSFSEPGAGYALVAVVDQQDRPVLCGFVDAADAAGAVVDVHSTATALLYFAIGAFALPWDAQSKAIDLIRESPQTARLAAVLRDRLTVDPLGLSDGDAAIGDAIAEAAVDLVPYLLPHAQAAMAAVRPAQVDTADGVTPASITVDPSDAQSGICISPSTAGNGITITNSFRRHTQYYMYRRGWEDQDGNYHKETPWALLVAPGAKDFCYLPATNGLSGAIGTLVDLLVGGQVPYASQSIPLVPITIDPPTAKRVDLQAYVMGIGTRGTLSGMPKDQYPDELRPAWSKTIGIMGLLTWAQEYFLPIVFAMLPVENYFKMATGREMTSLAQSIVQIFTDHGFDFSEQIAKGEFRAATGTALRVLADNETVRKNVISAILHSGLLWGKLDDIAAKSVTKLASHALLLDKLFTGADIAVVMVHANMSDQINMWAITAVPPEVKVQPKPDVTVAPGETTELFCTCGTVVGEMYYHWGSLSDLGAISDSKGNSGQVIVTTDSRVNYTAKTSAPLGGTDTVKCSVTFVSKGQTITLGTDGTTVKIDANRVQIQPISAPVSRGGLRQLNCYVNGAVYGGDYHWTTPGKHGHLEDFTKGHSGTDFWSTDCSVKYIADVNAPDSGTETVEVEIRSYPDRHNYIGKTRREISFTPAKIVLSPRVLQCSGDWRAGGTEVQALVEGDGFYGVWGPKLRYRWRCGVPWKLTDNKDIWDSTSYLSADPQTYPYPPGGAKDGASTWVEGTVYVEDSQGDLEPLGFAGAMVEYRRSASFHIVCGGCEGQEIVRKNSHINISRHPITPAGWDTATYWFNGLRTGDKLILKMTVQSVPQGQQQALATVGPLYMYGSIVGADGKRVTRCEKISNGYSKMLRYGETHTETLTVPYG